MDVSALSVALHQLTAAVVTGLGLLGPDVQTALRLLMMLSYTLALLLWLFEGRAAVHGPFLRMLLKFAAIGALVEWFPTGSAALMQAAAQQGLNLVPGGGFSLNDPGYIAHLGIQVVIPLMRRVKEMLGPIDFFLNFVEIVLFLLAALVVIVSFCILAIQVFLAFLEYRLLSLAAYLAIPFAVLGPTSFVAERAIGYIAASALKLLVLARDRAAARARLIGGAERKWDALMASDLEPAAGWTRDVADIRVQEREADPKTGATAFTVVWTETVYRDFKTRSRALMSAAVVTVDGPSREGALDGVSISGFSEPSGTPLTPEPKELPKPVLPSPDVMEPHP